MSQRDWNGDGDGCGVAVTGVGRTWAGASTLRSAFAETTAGAPWFSSDGLAKRGRAITIAKAKNIKVTIPSETFIFAVSCPLPLLL